MQPCCIIPAHMDSRRFPGKPLVEILGIPMVIRVADICRCAVGADRVAIASPDSEILHYAVDYGYHAVQTPTNLNNGNECCAHAAKALGIKEYLNVQGDEPCLTPEHINRMIAAMCYSDATVFGMYGREIDVAHVFMDQNVPKLKVSHGWLAKGARKVEGNRHDWHRQVCVFGFRKLPWCYTVSMKTPFEKEHDICLLRALESGYGVDMIYGDDTQAVDLPEHIEIVEKILRDQGR